MHVLQLTNSFRSFFNHQIDALREQDIEVTTLCVPGQHTADNEAVDRRSIADYVRFYPDVLQHATESYDIIHANHGLTAPYAIGQPHRPIVLTLWGSDLVGKLGPVSRRLSYFFDEVVLPSENMSSSLPRQHATVPFPIDTEKFRPIPRHEAREFVGWDEDPSVVLFPAAKSRPVKNYALAEEVIKEMEQDVDLRTLSNVPHDEVPYYMNASDAVLITSRRETGPMVVKEAAACNVPVVSVDVGFAAQVLEDVTHSHICTSPPEFAAKLDRIVATNVRSDGSKKSKEWSTTRMGEQLVSVYQRLL